MRRDADPHSCWIQLDLIDYLNRINEILAEPIPPKARSMWSELATEIQEKIEEKNEAKRP